MVHQQCFGFPEHLPTDQRGFEAEVGRETHEGQEVLHISIVLVVSQAVSRGSEVSSDNPMGICGGLAWLGLCRSG